ncbi:MAG: HupE/UreJ family protein [Gammaproteobacteria bacterium]|nr:HupE/UreJ family protein [Gammaproteobacteria bacterium]
MAPGLDQAARFLSGLMLIILSTQSAAHEVRPAYLDIRAESDTTYQIFWKVPAQGGVGLPITIRWPQLCQIDGLPDTRLLNASYIERSTLKCSAPIEGQVVELQGLENTLTDTLIRYTNLAGQVQSDRLTPSSTAITIKSEPKAYAVLVTYLELGVEHIWFGIDHLLFVICLLFIAGTFRRVLITITGFTIAHSITLISAALGLVTLNPAPVEAVIALSIVFVAREIVLGNKTSVAYRYPVAVAFIFGLLHGFGFAAALGEIGLPYSDKLLALLMFNLGVEVGQVVFITAVILVSGYARKWANKAQAGNLTYFSSYGIGVISCYWFLIRLLAI